MARHLAIVTSVSSIVIGIRKGYVSVRSTGRMMTVIRMQDSVIIRVWEVVPDHWLPTVATV